MREPLKGLITVRIDNDVKMGMYGEHVLGAARRAENVLGIFLAPVSAAHYRGSRMGVAGVIFRPSVSCLLHLVGPIFLR